MEREMARSESFLRCIECPGGFGNKRCIYPIVFNFNQTLTVNLSGHMGRTFPSIQLELSLSKVSLRRRKASLTSSSGVRLNAARTYAVFLPLGRKTVPGRARTPLSNAFVLIITSESPSDSAAGSSEGRRSLNLQELWNQSQ